MKTYDRSAHDLPQIRQLLSNIKDSLTSVLADKTLCKPSRKKLQDCVFVVEKISKLLRDDDDISENFMKPLHCGLSRSMDSLDAKTSGELSGSKSTSDLLDEQYKQYGYENDEINSLSQLKDNYLQVLRDVNNNHEMNGKRKTEVNNSTVNVDYTKQELSTSEMKINGANPDENLVSSAKPEENSPKPDVNSSKSEVNSSEPDSNSPKTEINSAKLEINSDKPDKSLTKPEDDSERKPEAEVKKRRRKRDSSTLFDISLDDLTEPDHSGFLREKHSGKEWWCVLQDQHLCMFPSQNPQELAYDVLLVPCCEISLDDVYTESPVFRLTQVGSTPWVFSAGIERNLRAWIRALYRACGRDDAHWSMRSSRSKSGRKKEKKQRKNDMKVFSTTIQETDEVEDELQGEDLEEEKNKGMGEKLHEVLVDEYRVKVLIATDVMDEKQPIGKEVDDFNTGTPQDDELSYKAQEQATEENVEDCNREITKDEELCDKDQKQPTANKIDDRHRETVKDEFSFKDQEKISQNPAPNKYVNVRTRPTQHGVTSSSQDSDDSQYIEMNAVALPRENSQAKAASTQPPLSSPDENNHTKEIKRRKTRKRRIRILKWLNKNILGNEEDVTVIGDIYKLEQPNNNRVRLWCLVRNKQLYCYRNIMDEKIDCVIPLEGCRAVPTAENTSRKFSFQIERNSEKLCTLVATSATERTRWMEIVTTKRGTVSLGEYDEEKEEIEGDEKNEEDGGTEEKGEIEESDEDDEGYVFPDLVRNPNVVQAPTEINVDSDPEYVTAMDDDFESDEAGYVSVLALESEIMRQKTCKKMKKFNPNVRSKTDLRNLTETESLLATMIHTGSPVHDMLKKRRLPALPPTTEVCFAGKKAEGKSIENPEPGLEIDSDAEQNSGEETQGKSERDLDEQACDGSLSESCDDVCVESKNTDSSPATNSVGEIRECQMTASSWLHDSPPHQARFGQRSSPEITGAWRPEVNDKNQYLEIDLGDVTSVSAIAIQGRPDYDEDGGEFVKSFTLLWHGAKRDTWIAYKSLGKVKVFQGNSSPNQAVKKSLKNVTARYIRVHPQSWHNYIALRVAIYREQATVETNMKLKRNRKKAKEKTPPADAETPALNTVSTPKRGQLTKKDISSPVFQFGDNISVESPLSASVKENGVFRVSHDGDEQCEAKFTDELTNIMKNSTGATSLAAQSIESRIKLRETLLSKEKKEQILILEGLKKRMDYAKDKMIVMNNSSQHKKEAVDTEEEFLRVNLDLVKVKKRLIDIETEMRELRLFAAHYREEQEEKRRSQELLRPAKKPLTRRPSKEIKVLPDVGSPSVDRQAFNPPGEVPPPLKVKDNVKIFETLQSK